MKYQYKIITMPECQQETFKESRLNELGIGGWIVISTYVIRPNLDDAMIAFLMMKEEIS